ncbi:hypothetical protein K450DRAFT_224428 [Umbelopsis ramanniana AG]|uniref:Uncharacterized protein n=1 Tax=Umbelopsis ramanniana AG TaxID=1314678 RepID=A0AAD5EFZ6_UMBRA|nr:uncharacterized protein K450DRAFT_224428 [Umbelopsis ramanniana AG]KAI8583146.1 hypothetical protein K450DRAFT_224428 [Umbelopsis ramanniana AG]
MACFQQIDQSRDDPAVKVPCYLGYRMSIAIYLLALFLFQERVTNPLSKHVYIFVGNH